MEKLKRRSILNSLSVFVLLVSATGCATRGKLRAGQQEIDSRNVDPAVHVKIEKNEQLDLGDIEHLVEKDVSDKTILSYLQQTRAIYSLKTQDIDRLRNANVSERLIDYLISTPTRYGFELRYSYPYFHGPLPYGHGFHPYGYGYHRLSHGYYY